MADNKSLVVTINEEINRELVTPEVCRALLATTFKGLEINTMKQALMEGMIRGYSFKDFLQKNIYAVKFGSGYALVTSIDDARKKGAKSGVVGEKKPVYEMDGNKIISCDKTILKKTGSYIGEYTATVYFEEYYKAGKNGYPSLWDSKPRTMIAKVAEMHALRMACPEELSQVYVEEEFNEDEKNEFNRRKSEVENDSKNLTMGNLLKNGETKKDQENTNQEENKDEVGNAESNEINPFNKGGE